jgi:hypothetical protein
MDGRRDSSALSAVMPDAQRALSRKTARKDQFCRLASGKCRSSGNSCAGRTRNAQRLRRSQEMHPSPPAHGLLALFGQFFQNFRPNPSWRCCSGIFQNFPGDSQGAPGRVLAIQSRLGAQTSARPGDAWRQKAVESQFWHNRAPLSRRDEAIQCHQ